MSGCSFISLFYLRFFRFFDGILSGLLAYAQKEGRSWGDIFRDHCRIHLEQPNSRTTHRYFQRTGLGMSRMTKSKVVKVIEAEFCAQPSDGDVFLFLNKNRSVLFFGTRSGDEIGIWEEVMYRKKFGRLA